MSGVTAIKTATGTTCVGEITLTSTVPTLLSVSNTPTAPYTVNFAPISANIATLNGKTGNAILQSSDNTLNITPVPLSQTIQLSGYVPTGSGGAGSALLAAQNLTGTSPLSWSGDTSTPPISTLAYTPGALVIYSGTTFVCLVAQPVGSALPVAGANWASIGGGTTGSSITAAGSTVACDATLGVITIDTSLSTGSQADIALRTSATATNVGVNILTNTTLSTFDNYGSGANPSGVISLTTTDASGASVTIGGSASVATGLWVGQSNLTFNGTAIGSSTTQISQGGGSVAVDSGGAISATTASNASLQMTAQGTGNMTLSGNNVKVQSPAGACSLDCQASGIISLTTTLGPVTISTADTSLVFDPAGGSKSLLLTASNAASSCVQLVGYGDGTSNAGLQVGGTSNATGLWVGDAAVTFNGATLGGSGNVNYTPTTFPWTSGASYAIGDIVSDKGQVYVATLANTAGTANEPFNTPATWQPIGGVNANIFGGAWDANSGYGVGTIVNSTAGTSGLYVCILPVPPAVSPATNPAPSASPTYWTVLNATGLPTGGAMTLNPANWDVTTAYPSQTLLNNWDTYGSFLTTAPVTGGDPPWTNPPPANWTNLTFGYSYYYGAWDNAGTTTYPIGSMVSYLGGIYSALVTQTAPITTPPPPSDDTTNWAALYRPPVILNSVSQSLATTSIPLVAPGSFVSVAGVNTIYNNALVLPGYPATTAAAYPIVPNATYRLSGTIQYKGAVLFTAPSQFGFNLNGGADGTSNVALFDDTIDQLIDYVAFNFDVIFTAPANATVLGGYLTYDAGPTGGDTCSFDSFLSVAPSNGFHNPLPNAIIIQRLS